MAYTLAVAHDVFGEIGTNAAQSCFEGGEIRARDTPRGDEHHRVRCARIAIHRDAVEGFSGHAREHGAQLVARHSQVGQNIDQHGGKVGLNHASPFGDADDAAGAECYGTDFWIQVGGHDALRRREDVAGGERGFHVWQRGKHGLDGQAPADDPGGAGQYFTRSQAEQCGGGGANRFAGRHAAGSAHVGNLVIDDDGSEPGFGQSRAAHDDRGAGKGVFGKDGGEVRGRVIKRDECKRHLRWLGCLLGEKLEAGGADAEALRQGGLRG